MNIKPNLKASILARPKSCPAPKPDISTTPESLCSGFSVQTTPSRQELLAAVKPTAQALEPTEPDIDGPYYRAGAPKRSRLFYDEGDPKKRINLHGQVLDTSGQVIPKAKLDFWLADPEGNYDNDSPDFKGRGWQQANKEGHFNLETARPGNYSIPGQTRPAHIHVTVSAEGYKPLTTQLYFKDDPHNSKDPWFSEKRSLDVLNSDYGNYAKFDFVLQK